MDKISLKYHLAFYFILLIMFLSCSPSEPESSDYICLEEIECTLGTNTSINSENYYCNDLVILQDFINANTQTYRHYLDQNAINDKICIAKKWPKVTIIHYWCFQHLRQRDLKTGLKRL